MATRGTSARTPRERRERERQTLAAIARVVVRLGAVFVLVSSVWVIRGAARAARATMTTTTTTTTTTKAGTLTTGVGGVSDDDAHRAMEMLADVGAKARSRVRLSIRDDSWRTFWSDADDAERLEMWTQSRAEMFASPGFARMTASDMASEVTRALCAECFDDAKFSRDSAALMDLATRVESVDDEEVVKGNDIAKIYRYAALGKLVASVIDNIQQRISTE
jgi:hypothetical protein